MLDKLDIFYVVLVLAYLIGVGWYIASIISARKKKEGAKHTAHRRRSSHRREGKRCPQCSKVIDKRRSICRHCGHEFELPAGTEQHPDEANQKLSQPVMPSSDESQ